MAVVVVFVVVVETAAFMVVLVVMVVLRRGNRQCDHCGILTLNIRLNIAKQIMCIKSFIVLHNYNLHLQHLGMQLLFLILEMHSLLNLASSFNNYALHFPFLLLLH